MTLAIVETHPIQYHAPVYRALQTRFGVPVVAIYGSDFSVSGGQDREFGLTFAWDTDLLSGYDTVFLSRVGEGGARSAEQVSVGHLGQALGRTSPRAILLTGYSPRFHQMAFLKAWSKHVPLLFRGETIDYANAPVNAWSRLRDLGLRAFYARFAKLLFVGTRSQQHFLRLGCPVGKLIPSRYCVDSAPFATDDDARAQLRFDLRRRLGVDSDRIVILFSGKLSERKGPDLLLDAVRQLPPPLASRVVVLFLGSGVMEEQLRTLAGSSPGVEARFVGFQNQRQLSPFYHAADLLALPSRHSETWGLVVNEALHHGLPCVVSDAVGCVPDLVHPGDTGEVFGAGSSLKLADALARATSLIDRQEIRARCRQVVEVYSVNNAAAGIAAAYRDVVETSPQESALR